MRWTRRFDALVVDGRLSQNLAPEASPGSRCPGGPFQGAAERLGLGLLAAFGGRGVERIKTHRVLLSTSSSSTAFQST